MRVGIEEPHRLRRRPAPYLGLLALCLLFTALTATPAIAAGPNAAPQSAQLADRLRVNPVYVTDQLPRVIPRSTAPDFARLAQRTGVPTYVLVLPDQGTGSGSLLGAVHDRLGRDGLYVLVDTMGIADARAFAVSAPADDARTVALYALPYDAGPLRAFQEFVDTVAQGSEHAAQRAGDLRKRYGGTGKEVGAFYISGTDRANQSFLTGIALLGLPLLVLLASPYVRRWRHRGPDREDSARGPRPLPNAIELAVAAAVALCVGVGAPHLFHQTTDSAAPPPTRADMTARLDRIAAGLRHDPLYTDPESPQLLDAQRMAELDNRIRQFTPGPVYITVVPQPQYDESGGDSDTFAGALHNRLGRNGLYVVADPLSGDISLTNYGLPLDDDRLALNLPDAIRHDDLNHPSDDHRLGQRLDLLMTSLDGTPRTSTPSESGSDSAAPPVDNHVLPPLYSGDFWPGLWVGALTAAMLFALIAGGLGIVRAAGKRRRPPAGPVHQAPAKPSAAYLRHTAQSELDALAAEFSAQPPNAAAQAQVWDCLDAAMLLTGHDSDSRIDDAATPADLVAAIVLARAGRAVLKGETVRSFCGINPLHGTATARQEIRLDGGRASRTQVCGSCRTVARREPHRIGGLRLTLPGRNGRTPYEEAPGALPTVREGLSRLIAKAREYASVQ
ncbi:hypothetical protein ABZ746_02430 [Streptomyces sp. NPDC020096]